MKAFPNAPFSDAGRQQDTGMDLRDYFAAKAMQAKLTREIPAQVIKHVVSGKTIAEWMANQAYVMADAMMKEREKTGE